MHKREIAVETKLRTGRRFTAWPRGPVTSPALRIQLVSAPATNPRQKGLKTKRPRKYGVTSYFNVRSKADVSHTALVSLVYRTEEAK